MSRNDAARDGVITVKLNSPFNELVGAKEVFIEVPKDGGETLTVGWAIDEVARRTPVIRRLLTDRVQRKYFQYALNGKEVGENCEIHEGDEVELYAPLMGG